MTTVLNTRNCSFHKLGFVNTHRTVYKTRLSHGLRTDASGKFPEYKKVSGSNTACSNSFLGSPNKIGIIGGASVVSTVNFLRKLAHWSKDGESCPPFVVCSDPVLSKELLLIERSSFPSPNPTKSSRTELDPTSVVENLRSKRIYLENSGARCIVMPCHISHSWHDEISEGCSVPFLHMGECVSKELKKAKLKPLEAGSRLRIGVLSTHATLTAGFYQEKLQSEVILFLQLLFQICSLVIVNMLNHPDAEENLNIMNKF